MLTKPMILSKFCVIIVLLVKKKRNVSNFQVSLLCDIRTETVFVFGQMRWITSKFIAIGGRLNCHLQKKTWFFWNKYVVVRKKMCACFRLSTIVISRRQPQFECACMLITVVDQSSCNNRQVQVTCMLVDFQFWLLASTCCCMMQPCSMLYYSRPKKCLIKHQFPPQSYSQKIGTHSFLICLN